MSYEPNPIDTSDVELPADILALGELMAENAHEVWAQHRILTGWTYGGKLDSETGILVRDDAEKKHPLLRPYAELDYKEQEYDRRASIETLKFIIKKGYTIRKK